MKTTIAFYLRDRYYQMDGELSEEDFEKAEYWWNGYYSWGNYWNVWFRLTWEGIKYIR